MISLGMSAGLAETFLGYSGKWLQIILGWEGGFNVCPQGLLLKLFKTCCL